MTGPLVKSFTKSGGASIKERMGSMKEVMSLLGKTVMDRLSDDKDPLLLLRKRLVDHTADLEAIEKKVNKEMEDVVEAVLTISLENGRV